MGILSKIEEKLAGAPKNESEAGNDGAHIGYTGQATGSGTGMVGGHTSNQTTGSSGVTSGRDHQALAHGTDSGSQGLSAKTAALMGHTTSHNSDTPNLPGQFDSGSTTDRSHELRHPIQSSTGRDFADQGSTTTTNTTTTTGTTAQYPTGSTSTGSSGQYPTSSTTGSTAGRSLRHSSQNITSNEYGSSTGNPSQYQGSSRVGEATSGTSGLRHPNQNITGHEYSGNNPGTAESGIGQASSGYGSVQGGNGQYPTAGGIGQATSDYGSTQGTPGQYQTGGGIGQATSDYGSARGIPGQHQTGSGITQASSGYGSASSGGNQYASAGTGIGQTSTGQHGTSHTGATGAGVGAAAAATGYEASRLGQHDSSDRHSHHNTSDKVRANAPYDPYSTAGQKAAFDANTKSGSNTASASHGLGSRSAIDDRETTSTRHGSDNSTINTGPRQALENKDAIPTAGGEKLGGASGPKQGYETRGGSTTGGSYIDESSSGARHHHDSHAGRDAALSGGAGAYGSGKSGHHEEKPSMMDKVLHRSGHEGTSTGVQRQHDSHHGRDAAVAGGVGAAGAGAYESGKSGHHEEKPSMMDKVLHRTGHEEPSTGTQRQQHDSHYGRDAAVAGGAGAIGAGAYESGKSGHHEEKPSMMDKVLHRTGHESSKDEAYGSHENHNHAGHHNTTDLTDRTYGNNQTHNRSNTGTGHSTTSTNLSDISYMNPSTSTTNTSRHDPSTSSTHHHHLGAGAGAGGALGGAALGFQNASRNDPTDSTHHQTSGLGSSNTASTKHDKTWPSGDSSSLGQTQSSTTTGMARDHSGIGQHYQAGYEAGYQAGLRDGRMHH
nr:hypothetical protein CFP56_04564 [Quercus suber]